MFLSHCGIGEGETMESSSFFLQINQRINGQNIQVVGAFLVLNR